MTDYSKYKESAFTHEEMQPMIIETDMTDIVERLRLIDPTLELRYAEDVTKLHEIGMWCNEAADEIERLRAEVEWHEEENHRLRAALHKIAEWDLTGTAIAALGEKE